jgi:hypothetical protein
VCLLRGATTVFKYKGVNVKERVTAEAGNGRHVPADWPGLVPRPVRERLVAVKVTPGQLFLCMLRCFPLVV